MTGGGRLTRGDERCCRVTRGDERRCRLMLGDGAAGRRGDGGRRELAVARERGRRGFCARWEMTGGALAQGRVPVEEAARRGCAGMGREAAQIGEGEGKLEPRRRWAVAGKWEEGGPLLRKGFKHFQ
jgi:hypothetical protein